MSMTITAEERQSLVAVTCNGTTQLPAYEAALESGILDRQYPEQAREELAKRHAWLSGGQP